MDDVITGCLPFPSKASLRALESKCGFKIGQGNLVQAGYAFFITTLGSESGGDGLGSDTRLSKNRLAEMTRGIEYHCLTALEWKPNFSAIYSGYIS